MSQGPLISPSQPIVLTENRFVVPHETKFKLSEQYMSFSSDDFTITDTVTGNPAFVISGKSISLSKQKLLYDHNNIHVWTMKNKLITIGRSYQVLSPTNVSLFTIKNHHRWLPTQGRKLSTEFAGGTIVLKASKMDKLGVITFQDKTGKVIPIAKITRPLHTVRNMFHNVQDYEVTIAPNVDIAAILAFCLTLDEEGERKKG